MRGSPLVVLAACAVGCFFQPMEAPQADSATIPATTTTGPPTTSEPLVCQPGSSIPCNCEAGFGEQTCTPDGQGYDECECPVDPTTTTTTTTTGDPDTSSSTTATSTTTDTTAPLDTTTTTTTGDSTTTTTGTTTGTDSSTGDSSTTGMMMCEDDGEPGNNNYLNATQHPDQGCLGSHNFTSTLAGQDDTDWHTFQGKPGGACNRPPRLQVNQESDAEIRLCVYLVCAAGNLDLECNSGTYTDAMLAEGCCGTGDIDIFYDCTISNGEVIVFVSLDESPVDMCVDYQIDYNYVP
jgi:hypothetical protein